MPDLSFQVRGAVPVEYAAAPTLALQLEITNQSPEETIRGIALQCQIQIEAPRRTYTPHEQSRLVDLFGEPERWGRTLRTSLWTHASVNVPPFADKTNIDVPVPCSFDFNVAATKYFDGLESGDVPLCVLFSGTVFLDDPERGLTIAQIPWAKEARFRLPIGVWKAVIDLYYPNTAWLTLRRDVFNRLHEYKMRNSIPTWEMALERLLA
jgi:hypothetical protein